MIETEMAVKTARGMLGVPYGTYDCINFIKRILRTCPGGEAGYQVAGTNSLWRSRDLLRRQEGTRGACPGMLAFKVSGRGAKEDVHHVGLVTAENRVIHSSSARGMVVETDLQNGQWHRLAEHRLIAVKKEERNTQKARVCTRDGKLNLRSAPGKHAAVLGKIPGNAVVEVLEETGRDWWKVCYEGNTGYAAAGFLVRIPEEGAEPAEETRMETTSLISGDGQSVVLVGRWRIAED